MRNIIAARFLGVAALVLATAASGEKQFMPPNESQITAALHQRRAIKAGATQAEAREAYATHIAGPLTA